MGVFLFKFALFFYYKLFIFFFEDNFMYKFIERGFYFINSHFSKHTYSFL
jgi:hypothetical protein